MLAVAIILLLIMVNGLFALAEISFVSVRRSAMEHRLSQGDKRAGLVLKMMDQPDRFLSSMQVGITLIGVVSGAFGGATLAHDVSWWIDRVPALDRYSYQIALAVVVTAVTYLSIVIGELVPKTLALKNPERVALELIPFINTFSSLVHPAVSFLSFSTKAALRLFGMKISGIGEHVDPIKEILGMAKMAAVRNKIDKEQEQIIANAMNIKNLRVRNIMVRLAEVRVLKTSMSLSDALVSAHVHHHTRYPLVDEEQGGAIIGYINFKDIVNTLRLNPASPTLKGISRPVMWVREDEGLSALLRTMIRTHQHIAMVRGQANAVSGLVSLEDMLETIVGDIKDEYDIQPDFMYDISDERVLAGGGVLLTRVRERVSNEIPAETITLGQWLIDIAGKPLRVESKVLWKGMQFEIRKMSRSRIYEVIIDWSPREASGADRTAAPAPAQDSAGSAGGN